MREQEQRLRKGFRLYSTILDDQDAKHWQSKLDEEQSRMIIRSLEEREVKILIASVKGIRGDGIPFAKLHVSILQPDRPINDDERSLINRLFGSQNISFRGGFPEDTEPPNDKWEIVYSTPKPNTDPDVSPSLREEIEKVLSPLIDLDVQQQEITTAISVADLSAHPEDPDDQITKIQTQRKIELRDRLVKMRASGFYRVIDWDSRELNDPSIAGEFDNFEEAIERANEKAAELKSLWIKTYQKILNESSVESEGYLHCQKKLQEAEEGGNLTSTTLYVYGPSGEILERFPV